MADLTHLALAVDALLTERALVYGSLPDDAHDLDLLVRRRSVVSVPPSRGRERTTERSDQPENWSGVHVRPVSRAAA